MPKKIISSLRAISIVLVPLLFATTIGLTWHYSRLYHSLEVAYANLIMVERAWLNRTGSREMNAAVDLAFSSNLHFVKKCKKSPGGETAFRSLVAFGKNLDRKVVERIVDKYE